MIKYKLFFVGYGGQIFDAYKNGVIEVELMEKSVEKVAEILGIWNNLGELRKDLTFVILPVFCNED